MIRFLKNIVADSEITIDLHSFEINAVCYNCPPAEYQNLYYLDLARYIWRYMLDLHQDTARLNALKSVDGCEFVEVSLLISVRVGHGSFQRLL